MANGTLLIAPTRECLEDFFQRFPAKEAAKLLGELTHANYQTVSDWSTKRYFPQGELLLRLRCFLDLVGYRVTEFEDHPEVARQFARLIAFDIFTIEDARKALSYENTQEVYNLLLRNKSLRRERAGMLTQCVRENLELLNEAVASWQPQIEQIKQQANNNRQSPLPAQGLPSEEDSGEVEDQRKLSLTGPAAAFSTLPTAMVGADIDAEVEVVYHLIMALDSVLDNGIHPRGGPAPLSEERRVPIYKRVGEARLRLLIAKLERLSLFS